MAHPRFSTVLFDCDGTLLNTINDLACAGNLTCQAHGWPTHDVETFKRMVGNGQRVLVERFVPASVAADPDALEAAYQEFVRLYGVHQQDTTGPYEGIVSCIERLRAAGVRVGMLTNKNHEQAIPLAEKFFPGLLDAAQGRVDSMPAKPAAPMTLALMEALGADPASTLMVGDTSVDIACGKNAGLASCGITWGFRGREELVDAGADFIVDTPDELACLVLG